MRRIIVLTAVFISIGLATANWQQEDFAKAEAFPKSSPVMQFGAKISRGDWQSWSYIHELCHTAAFVAAMQVADSLDPEFGGIIEGENQLDVIETDNTQQAIWVWSRYYEITADTTYFVNIRRAWIYVMNFPAYGEGAGFYSVWNCGLALFAESKYRNTFNDSSYFLYADTCAKHILHNPLSFDDPNIYYRRLHPKVTSCVAGMLYQYGKELSNQIFQDTALVYGDRVKVWIEEDPDTNINDEVWAMSGGTAVWGLCRSIFDADTASGITWLNTYLPYMKYYQPTGMWNNSWNIWYANAYNFAARITQNLDYAAYHHGLTDSLLIQDYDDDGGVPPTRTWGASQDHSWVSNYMVFMGFEGLMDSIKDFDAGVNGIYAAGPQPYLLSGDSIYLSMRVANYGFAPLPSVYFAMSGPYNADTSNDLDIGEEDTIHFSIPWSPNDTGYYDFTGFCQFPGDERSENDTFYTSIYIRPLRLVSGLVKDLNTSSGIYARLYFQFINDTGSVYFDSCVTDSSTGNFSVYLIDSLYRAFVYTEIPYPDFLQEDIFVTPDSISALDFYLKPADILVVNRDNEARYAEFYTDALDSIGISYKVWAPVIQGIFPISRIIEFNENAIIWYTGRAESDNVTPAEQESLVLFLDASGKLLITGQNIGEEISQTLFYTDYLHAQLINDSINSMYCYPDTSDSLGQNIGKLQTTDAYSQYSRDVIAADAYSHGFTYYDTSLTNGAGIWYTDPMLAYQTTYCGFGIEAVHTRPGYMSRYELIATLLEWFGITGIYERTDISALNAMFVIYPNPVVGQMNIHLANISGHEEVAINIYDAVGRLVKTISNISHAQYQIWDLRDANGRRVPGGVYFVQLRTDEKIDINKAVIIE